MPFFFFFLSNKELLQVAKKSKKPHLYLQTTFLLKHLERLPLRTFRMHLKFANISKRRHNYTFSLGVGGRDLTQA
jgi:hypothetical protein